MSYVHANTDNANAGGTGTGSRATRLTHGRFSTATVRFSADLEEPALREAVVSLCTALNICRVTASILVSRGITDPQAAKSFLAPTLKNDLPDPGQIKNITAAAQMLLEFVQSGKKIVVFHDFDVDGLTAGAQLGEFLLALGANVECIVPNRFTDGYGLTFAALDKIIAAKAELLVTVDCGIASVKEIAFAKSKHIRTIIVDHHEPDRLPDADVIVDPAQDGCPFQHYKMAAAGLVWMLLIVLRREARALFGENARTIPDAKDFLDLAAIGTICDMVPLTGVNRIIAHRGIDALRNTTRIGLIALKEIAGANLPRFGCGHIAFGLGPRINAAGRLEDAALAATLLTTTDTTRAKKLAESIDRLNSQRKTVEEEVRERCISLLLKDVARLDAAAFAVYQEDFHLGVLGIAAQRLVEEFHKPAAVMGMSEVEIGGKTIRVAKGSVRSIEGFHVADALHGMGDLLISGGGHAQAGGFTVALDRLEEFQAAFIAAAASVLTEAHFQRTQRADLKVRLVEVDFKLVDELQLLAPFGIGNPSPILYTDGVYIDSATALSGKHLRMRISDGTCSRNTIGWNFLGHPLLRKGTQVSIAYQAELNSYQGISTVQLNLKQVWPA